MVLKGFKLFKHIINCMIIHSTTAANEFVLFCQRQYFVAAIKFLCVYCNDYCTVCYDFRNKKVKTKNKKYENMKNRCAIFY